MKTNKNGLVPLFMLRAYEPSSNVAGDIAGFRPAVAEVLVREGYAEEYSADKHKRPDREKQPSLERIMTERNMPHFRPAELIHEDEAAAREALAQVTKTERVVPSTTSTRQEIEESGTVVERELVPAMTTAQLPGRGTTADAASAASTPPAPPASGDGKSSGSKK